MKHFNFFGALGRVALSALFALLLTVGFSPTAEAQAGLVSSFSKNYQTTTTSTDFYLTVGLAAAVYVPEWEVWPGGPVVPARWDIDWRIARAPVYKIFNHETPGAFLFEDIPFGISDKGQTFTISSVGDDSDFDDFAGFLTNGTDDNIWEAWMWPMHPSNNAGGIRCAGGPRGFHFESDVFPGTDIGSDHPEWVVQSVSLTFDDIHTERRGNFDWLTIDYTVDIAYGPAGAGNPDGNPNNPTPLNILAPIYPVVFALTGIVLAFALIRVNAIAAVVVLVITVFATVLMSQVSSTLW